MGFITQTFGSSFWMSHSDAHQSPAGRERKIRPKHKHSKDDSCASIHASSVSQAPVSNEAAGAHKKRRHASPDAAFGPQNTTVASDMGRPSCSLSVGSDEPLILPTSRKGKSSGSNQPRPACVPNPNQSAYTNGSWSNAPQSPPRLQARPPTTNILDTHERSELIRRSRKLGSILGETPRLLDVEEESGALEALNRLEALQAGQTLIGPATPSTGRPGCRRSLTLDATSVGSGSTPSRPSSASRHSFFFNDENSRSTRHLHRGSGTGAKFGRARTSVRHPPVLRLSATPVGDTTHPYFGRRHSSDLSVRRGASLNSLDMNVAIENESNVSAPKAHSFDTSSLGSSTMPTFARPRSSSPFLDNASLSSKISLGDSLLNLDVGVPGPSMTLESSPPSPTTPLTPLLTQAEDARRKMRKLARHLGESVPADLVIGIAGARRAAHDHLTEPSAPQFLQVPSLGGRTSKSNNGTITPTPFSLGRPPPGHRKGKSVWKGSSEESPAPPRLVRRASSAEQLRVEASIKPQMTTEEKARNVRRAMKMLQLFGAPPPNELYTESKSHSLDLPPSATFANASPTVADQRASINSLKDLAYILDHDNRNSLLLLIDDAMLDIDCSNLSPFSDVFESKPTSQSQSEDEPFQARRIRANRLAKFFGVSYRDLFDAVCAEDTTHLPDPNNGGAAPSIHPMLNCLPQPNHDGSEVITNNGSKWVEPKSVDEVLDRLRAMKTSR